MNTQHETAIFGGGCFWCVEAVFSRLKGVSSVVSGYAGGTVKDPSYYDVTSGETGHAEVIRIEFDPAMISYDQLLDIFFAAHDPTELNRQGPDQGSQYRSVILYTSEEQKTAAEKKIETLNKSHKFSEVIVTHVQPLRDFYTAEEYHQKYFEKNPDNFYCQINIPPKIMKLEQQFSHLLKDKS